MVNDAGLDILGHGGHGTNMVDMVRTWGGNKVI